MRSSADFRMELPSVGVVLVGTDTMADRGDSWTGDQREAGTSRWPPVGTWVWPPVDTFSWPGTSGRGHMPRRAEYVSAARAANCGGGRESNPPTDSRRRTGFEVTRGS